MALVLNHSKASGTDKLILIGIANHEGDGGAWPSIETLMRYANVNERAVQYALKRLEASGELVRKMNEGGTHTTRPDQRPNLYEIRVACPPECDRTTNHRLNGVQQTAPPVADGVQPVAERGAISRQNGVQPTAPEPSLEPSFNHPSSSDAVSTTPFGQLVALYPKVEKPRVAKAKFEDAVAKGADPSVIVAAARAQRTALLERESRYIPDLTSWLEDERWEGKLETRPPERETDEYGNVKNTRPLTDEEREELVRRAREKREQP